MTRSGVCFVFALVFLTNSTVYSQKTDTPFMKGVTVSCQGWGEEWSTPQMEQALDELQSMGVTWIALHPYAHLEDNGTIRYQKGLAYLALPLQWASERHMGVMLKPHLAYWGTRFSWRGDIAFQQDAEWNRFFDHYRDWIVTMARVAQRYGVPILCIGLEYAQTLGHEAQWRRVIGAIREVYDGKLTYGANWDEYQQVRFWDALDYIGIQAYFPLTETPDPSPEQIERGWARVFGELTPFAQKTGRSVIFTEIGYDKHIKTAQEPWKPASDASDSARTQEVCLKAALTVLPRYKVMAGLFLWKWFPGIPGAEENFILQTPEIKRIIRDLWGNF